MEGESALLAAVVRPSADAARAIPGGEPPDDVAIITLRILEPEATRLNISARATLRAARTLRIALHQFLAEQTIDADRAAEIQVAVGEAVNNVVEHAYGAAAGLVHPSGWFEGSTLVVEVRDHGRWRPERDERRGHGVKIMRSLADRVDLNTTPTGTVVRLLMTTRPDGSAVTASG